MFNRLELAESDLREHSQTLPYVWGRRQGDQFDGMTRDIYRINSLNELLSKYPNDNSELSRYAHNRWFNYKSAMAVEDIFCQHPNVRPESNKRNKLVDFYINNIPYDHKTTVIPNSMKRRVSEIGTERFDIDLIRWLYKNQSSGMRYHLSNRIFIVVVNSQDLDLSWRVKAELSLISSKIDDFLKGGRFYNFKCEKTGTRFSSGIIFVTV